MTPSRLPGLSALLKPICFLLLGFSACGGPGARLSPLSRSLELTKTVRLIVPMGKKSLRLWIPRPPSDSFQTAELLEVDSPWPRQDDADPDFNNQILYFDSRSPVPGAAEIRIKYRITRTEQTQPDPRGEPSLFQRPRGLVVVNDEIRRISAETTRGLEGTVAKARALYHYVLGHVDTTRAAKAGGAATLFTPAGRAKATAPTSTRFSSLWPWRRASRPGFKSAILCRRRPKAPF